MSSLRAVVRRLAVSLCLILTSAGALGQSPSCTVTANPSSGQAPLSVTVNAQCPATSGAATFSAARADFGDGNSTFNQPNPSFSHTYNRGGTFSVTVTATYSDQSSRSGQTTVTVTPKASAPPPAAGDIYISGTAGTIERRTASGALAQVLYIGQNDSISGMAFSSPRLFVTDVSTFSSSTTANVYAFDDNGNPSAVSKFTSGNQAHSIAFDSSGNAYVGARVFGPAIVKLDSSGKQVATFSSLADDTDGGTLAWLDLARDQCTIYYTLGTKTLYRYNVCTSTQATPLATALPGPNANEFRIRPNGEVVLADGDRVVRIDGINGAILQTYTPSSTPNRLYALSLDPDNSSFWVGDGAGQVYRFSFAGNLIGQPFSTNFTVQPGYQTAINGLSVRGELRAAINTTPSCTLQFDRNSGFVPFTVNATASCTDPENDITSASINWGDGTQPSSLSCDGTCIPFKGQHTYASAGTYTATVTATDAGGKKGSASQVVQVTVNQPPTCTLQIMPTSGDAPLTVNAQANCSDPDDPVKSASIDWNDGTTTALGCDGSCSFKGPHVYKTRGTYNATLTAIDNAGAASQPVTQTIVVTQPAKVISSSPLDGMNDKQRIDGQTKPLQVVLTNTSKARTVNFTGAATADNPAYTATTDCKSLAPGASCTVFASFKATQVCQVQNATITVPDDDPGGNATVTILGYGADTGFQLDDLTNSQLTPQALVNAIIGSGLTASNVKYTGASLAAGKFSSSSNIIGFNNGIVLSTGSVRNVAGQNCDPGITVDFRRPGDPDLDALLAGKSTTGDAAVLEFDFVPTSSVVSFQYVFSSDEYNEFVNTKFNDVFGFFLNGKNIALIPGTNTPVNINNVNGGTAAPRAALPSSGGTNQQFFINNDFDGAKAPVDTEMDGLTVVLTATGQVNPNQVNHIKLAIADAGDTLLDSNVFIQAGSFVSSQVTLSPSSLAFGNQTVGTTSAAQNATFTNNGTTPVTISSIAVSSGFKQTNNCPTVLAPTGTNGPSSCAISVMFAPNNTGDFAGTLTITDTATGSPHTVKLSGTGTAAPVPPTCTLAVNPNSGPAPLTVTATGSCKAGTSPISSTSLDFGDDSGQSGTSGTHTYNFPGTYKVTVRATDSNGLTGSATQTVTVGPAQPPVCTLNVVPNQGPAPLTVAATGNCTPGSRPLASTLLDFGDGTTQTSPSGSHIYAKAGTFTVTLTGMDAMGLKSAAMRTVTVTAASSKFPQGIFVGISPGTIKQFAPDGTVLKTLSTSLGGTVAGMAFDKAGNLYATDFTAANISKFDLTTGTLLGTFGSGFNCQPESLVFDGAGNLYVGQQGCSHAILKLDPSGKLVATYKVATEEEGSDDIDLSADQCTMLYTSEGSSILRYDVCRNQQMTPFARGLSKALMLRILPDGGVVVADLVDIVRLDASGQPVRTYSVPGEQCLYSITLDQDGTSFWAGDFCSSNIYRFDLNSGKQISKFNTGTPSGTVFGIAIAGSGLNVAGLGNAGNMVASPQSASLAAGQSATFRITFTPNATAAGSTLVLSCAGLPQGLSCSFNPPRITLGAAGTPSTATLTISRTTSARLSPTPPWMLATWMALVPAVVLAGLSSPRSRRGSLLWLGLIVVGTGMWAGCGGGGMSRATTPQATPQGSYTVIVVGNASGMQASTTVNLTVQ